MIGSAATVSVYSYSAGMGSETQPCRVEASGQPHQSSACQSSSSSPSPVLLLVYLLHPCAVPLFSAARAAAVMHLRLCPLEPAERITVRNQQRQKQVETCSISKAGSIKRLQRNLSG